MTSMGQPHGFCPRAVIRLGDRGPRRTSDERRSPRQESRTRIRLGAVLSPPLRDRRSATCSPSSRRMWTRRAMLRPQDYRLSTLDNPLYISGSYPPDPCVWQQPSKPSEWPESGIGHSFGIVSKCQDEVPSHQAALNRFCSLTSAGTSGRPRCEME